jgi:histidyl-tRNA synthetase
MHCGDAGLKSQMKKADQSGAGFAVLMGDDERANGMVSIKPLRADSGAVAQERVAIENTAAVIAGLRRAMHSLE